MGTWSVISAIDVPKELMPLLEELLGCNYSPTHGLFLTTHKTLSDRETIDSFAAAIGTIADRWRMETQSRLMQISLLCEETDPVVVTVEPTKFTVLFANGADRAHIESYQSFIEGSSAWHAEQERRSQKRQEEKLLAERRARRPRLDPNWPKQA
jgi:hypothetical protein